MENHSQNFKVKLGLFVAAGFILFLVAIFIIGKQKLLFDPVFSLTTAFRNVSGLQVGNNVRFSGINVGTVSNIELVNDTTVMVDMLIKKNIQHFIKKDCSAYIGSEGIIGDRVLIINQSRGETEIVENEEILPSFEPVETDAILASMNISARNLEIITGQLSEIMIKINYGEGTLGRLIQDSTLSENINQTIVNLKKSSKGLNENMEAAKSNFLLKGFFNRKERKLEKVKQDSIRKERRSRIKNK